MPTKPTTLTARANEANLDEMRLANHRLRVRDQHETELRDIEAKHQAEVTRVLERQSTLAEQLNRDYEVKISAEAMELEDRLQAQRANADARLQTEKATAEKEFERVRSQNLKRVEQYQKNSEARIETVRKQEQDATASLHARAKQAEKKLRTEKS